MGFGKATETNPISWQQRKWQWRCLDRGRRRQKKSICLSTVTRLREERNCGHIHFWHHLLQQVPGKHHSLLQRQEEADEECRGEAFWLVVLSVDVAEVADLHILHQAQVVHGAAECDLDCFADAGRAAFHQFDLVDGFVYSKRNHFGPRKPLPREVKQNHGSEEWQLVMMWSQHHSADHIFLFRKLIKQVLHLKFWG